MEFHINYRKKPTGQASTSSRTSSVRQNTAMMSKVDRPESKSLPQSRRSITTTTAQPKQQKSSSNQQHKPTTTRPTAMITPVKKMISESQPSSTSTSTDFFPLGANQRKRQMMSQRTPKSSRRPRPTYYLESPARKQPYFPLNSKGEIRIDIAWDNFENRAKHEENFHRLIVRSDPVNTGASPRTINGQEGCKKFDEMLRQFREQLHVERCKQEEEDFIKEDDSWVAHIPCDPSAVQVEPDGFIIKSSPSSFEGPFFNSRERASDTADSTMSSDLSGNSLSGNLRTFTTMEPPVRINNTTTTTTAASNVNLQIKTPRPEDVFKVPITPIKAPVHSRLTATAHRSIVPIKSNLDFKQYVAPKSTGTGAMISPLKQISSRPANYCSTPLNNKKTGPSRAFNEVTNKVWQNEKSNDRQVMMPKAQARKSSHFSSSKRLQFDNKKEASIDMMDDSLDVWLSQFDDKAIYGQVLNNSKSIQNTTTTTTTTNCPKATIEADDGSSFQFDDDIDFSQLDNSLSNILTGKTVPTSDNKESAMELSADSFVWDPEIDLLFSQI